jgi:hypothetical protein
MKEPLWLEQLSLSLSKEALWRGPREGGSFTGDPGRYVKAPDKASLSIPNVTTTPSE